MREDLLFVDEVTVYREETRVLDKVSLEIHPGEVTGVLGRNGAGKSSLAYALMGLGRFAPQSGGIYFRGEEITGMNITERARRGISLAWQHPARYEGISVKDYLKLSAASVSEAMMEDALQRVQLEPRYLERMMDRGLSGGERKRIELASVYLMKPVLAILDEPDSGVDLLALGEIMRLFRHLTENGSSVLIITHREDVSEGCDRSYLMCAGEIVLEGSPEAVKRYFMNQCTPCRDLDPHHAAKEV
ncbi:MAG: ATP-binding cassette domain-containing protein [Synergistales bacterium]|nr:ATP-binding cassette domain-containing protein [Synergistales bacterium]